jgi:hypothetical protein
MAAPTNRWLCVLTLALLAGCSGGSEREAERLRAARDELAEFKVYDAMLLAGDAKTQTGPSLVFSARNFTGEPISAIDVYVKYYSPNQTTPWYSGSFRYDIPGGLKPNGSQIFSLSSSDSQWKALTVRNDAQLEIMNTCLYGPDGNPATATFGLTQKQRLAKLEKK